MDDPDAIWKPGYEAPALSVVSATSDLDDPSPEPPASSPARPGRSRSWIVVGVVLVGVVVALVVGVVAVDPLGVGDESDADIASDGAVFAGPEVRRLPQRVPELWSVDIDLVDDASDHWIEVIGRELVVAAVAREDTEPSTVLLAFDALTGQQRWAFTLDGRPNDVAVVGAVGDVVVVEQPGGSSPSVVGIDAATGETRWSSESVPNAGHVAVVGTTSIARLPSSARGSVTMIDAVSGRELGAGSGDLAADDVGSLIPVSGSNFVETLPGSISGLVVEGDTQRVVWSRNEGAVVDQHPIDGGTLLQVATRGGAGMELVDGLTGESVENLAMVPGALQALVVAGNGIVVLRPAELGSRLVAIGFDGTERWAMLGSEPVVVGDRIVARARSTAGQLRISAYGDVE